VREVIELPPGQRGGSWWYAAAGRMHSPHTHAELELNLVAGGTARYLVGDRRYDLGPGTVVWLFPGQDHLLVDQSAGYAMWVALFGPGLVAAAEPPPVLAQHDPAGHFCRTLPAAEADGLAALLADIATAPAARANAGLAYLLHTAWASFTSAGTTVAGAAVHPAVEHAARVLRDESLPLPALAARVGLSPSRLSRVFRAQTGVSVTEFRNRQRIARFRQIHAGGRTTLMDAALRAGFGSYPQFHRVHTALTGEPPRAARRRDASGAPVSG
jgi:AraC-like DNA-binding protein/quercetin dioxygenase-like cupin family protein